MSGRLQFTLKSFLGSMLSAKNESLPKSVFLESKGELISPGRVRAGEWWSREKPSVSRN